EALGDRPLGRYNVEVTIVEFVPDHEIAWTIAGETRPSAGHIYGYTLEALDSGTLVTSYYDWSSIDQDLKKTGIFPVLTEGVLRSTLGILARIVERPRSGRVTPGS
ncbi:MAG: polyketide cyclase, partial [Acidimicrobiales bacterium]